MRGIFCKFSTRCLLLLALLLSSADSIFANLIYVANFASQNVSVIDSNTNTVIAVVPMPSGSQPTKIAITPDGKFAYVTNDTATNSISIIDTSNQTVVRSIPIGAQAGGIAITPNGALAYVTNFFTNTVTIIDLSTNSVTGVPIAVGTGPNDIAISPFGTKAYVANQLSSDITVIDLSTNTAVDSLLLLGADPRGVAFTPDGRFAYVTGFTNGKVYVIDTSTNTTTVDSPIFVGGNPYGLAVTPDGRFVYVVQNTAPLSIAIIDTQTNTVVNSIPLAQQGHQVAITPDGSLAYVTVDTPGNEVFVASTAAQALVGSPIPVGNRPFGIAITPSLRAPIVIPSSPINFRGCQFKNDIGLQFEFYNQLTWQQSPSSTPIQGFILFRNGKKIATLGPHTFCFQDHNRCKGVVTSYTLVAFDSNGNQSLPISFKVTPIKG